MITIRPPNLLLLLLLLLLLPLPLINAVRAPPSVTLIGATEQLADQSCPPSVHATRNTAGNSFSTACLLRKSSYANVSLFVDGFFSFLEISSSLLLGCYLLLHEEISDKFLCCVCLEEYALESFVWNKL
ncbi:hypothetical protein F2Q68_00008794 [Brassica cretica]|uniref:Gnk2-homologous domain-containing protein n=1 Tax=Brassica cretica TaxID=69181 RepID=A0A8S9KVN4_BRACR|nr:hypothetical protein F2Q68_00008794 [Brassica cretica]